MLELMKNGESPQLTHYGLAHDRMLKGNYQFEHSMVPHKTFEVGDIAVHGAGGAGGYGDVLERDPQMVIKDIKEGIVSDHVVREIYKVAYHPGTLEVDSQETDKLRENERKDRLNRGKPFNAFIKEWLNKKPKEELLDNYGDWPEPFRPDYKKQFWGIYD